MAPERPAVQEFYSQKGDCKTLRSATVIGAGVIGVCTAYALAKRGWRVTLVDQADAPAAGASHANGAQLSYGYADALGSPATLASFPKFLSKQGGVTMRLTGPLDYMLWLAQFACNCSSKRFQANTKAVLELAVKSRAAMQSLLAEHPMQFRHHAPGKIQLLYSRAEYDRAKASQDLKRAAGFEQSMVERDRLSDLDPALLGVDQNVIAAVSTPSEEVGDPRIFSDALLKILTEEYGVVSRLGESVHSINLSASGSDVILDRGERLVADQVVICAGHACDQLLRPLGHALPVQPMKGYSFEMPLSSGSPIVSVTDASRRLVFTNLGDRIRVAGFAELGNGDPTIEVSRIEQLKCEARACLPEAGCYDEADHYWAGLRPVTPNSRPIVKRLSRGLAVNTGHGSLGWTLAMGSGEHLAQSLGH
jgi:D-amino-acid dehydrogenase